MIKLGSSYNFLIFKIALETDIILGWEEDVISPVDERSESKLCFYDVLADHYVTVPENGKSILDLIVQLWSQSFASHIFALLFHKWVRELQSLDFFLYKKLGM